MPQLTIQLLGHFQAMLDGQPLSGFDSNKVRALLAYLAVEADRPHPRDELIGLLWPDQPDTAARASLRQALANLRQIIGDRTSATPFLSTTSDSIQFQRSEHCSIDVVIFNELIATCRAHSHRRIETCRSCAQRLQQAVELYRGDFLAQFVQSGSEAFEEWALIQRERLHREVLDALYVLAEHHERRSVCDQARHYATRQLELDPWREEAHRQLMRALALSGQRSAALAQYQTCRRILAEELGAEPSQETVALHAKIKADRLTRADQHHNLPTMLTSLIGRQRELSEIERLLETPTCRLLTLTGPGGIGKTRLALQAATQQIGLFEDGVWLVELAALSDPTLVLQAIATVLDVRESASRSLQDRLFDFLKSREVLLTLDNCEHLVEACAQLVHTLLRECPQISILATSREVLKIPGEVTFQVPPLTNDAAGQLFIERAVTAFPDFAMTQANEPAIAQICHRLDGMSLAIELAAARVTVLSIDQIATRLDDRFNLLTNGHRTVLPRHQTLRATIEWSHSLLTEQECILFRRLSVFASGWTLEAAEVICAGEGIESSEVLDLLLNLIDKSLILIDGHSAETRYHMLETIRQYAFERLINAHEDDRIQYHYVCYYCDLAEAATSYLHRSEQMVWLEHLDLERGNLREAMAWAITLAQAQVGLRMGAALRDYWFLRSNWREGRQWLERFLAMPEAAARTTARAAALNSAGYFAFRLNEPNAAITLLQESRDLSLELGAEGKPHLILSLVYLGRGLLTRDSKLARHMLDDSLLLVRDAGDTWQLAYILNSEGNWAGSQGDYDSARFFYQDSIDAYQKIGDRLHAAVPKSNLGWILYLQGYYGKARPVILEALEVFRSTGAKPLAAYQLKNLGCLAHLQGDYQQAVTCFEESLALYQETGSQPDIAKVLSGLGIALRYTGDLLGAIDVLHEALSLSSGIDESFVSAMCLMGLASIQQQPIRTVSLLAAVLAVLEVLGESIETVEPFYLAEYEHVIKIMRSTLDEKEFAAGWNAGHALTLEQAITLALAMDDAS
jgi:predicted ATPase/DNA-binding SARP family transcriptional activator